ncbi:MAG: HPF/RaiA family ribosome-associated protein [Opitutus sp.]
MNPTDPKVIVSAEGFSSSAELIAHAEAKVAKLRRHETPRIGHIRFHLRRETPHGLAPRFVISATAETRGIDFVAHAFADEPEVAINAVVGKLERAVTAAAGVRKHKRHCAPVIDLYSPATVE